MTHFGQLQFDLLTLQHCDIERGKLSISPYIFLNPDLIAGTVFSSRLLPEWCNRVIDL